MSEPTVLQRRILENHLIFTALHRAQVIRDAAKIRWESSSEAFCCVLLESAATEVPDDARAVRTFPWTGKLAAELVRQNFEMDGCLRYMVLTPGKEPSARNAATLDIRVALDAADLQQFSDVQSRGFLSPNEQLEPLYAFLHAANEKNLNHPNQTFYVGYFDGAPVAVTLLVVHEGTAGIYAVATLPDFRRRGFSRALLGRAIADGRHLGCDTVTLQVHQDSDAERLYRHLCFEVEFDCVLWKQAKKSQGPNGERQ